MLWQRKVMTALRGLLPALLVALLLPACSPTPPAGDDDATIQAITRAIEQRDAGETAAAHDAATAALEATRRAEATAAHELAEATRSAGAATGTAAAEGTAAALRLTAALAEQETRHAAASATAVAEQVTRGAATRAAGSAASTRTAMRAATAVAGFAAAMTGAPEELEHLAASYKELVYGPEESVLSIDDDEYIDLISTGVILRNFVLEADLNNPYSLLEGSWDHGIVFRSELGEANHDFRVVLYSNGEWSAMNLEGLDDVTYFRAGRIPVFHSGAGESNHVKLIAWEMRGLLYVNNELAGDFSLADRDTQGNILVGVGFWIGNSVGGAEYVITDLAVWALPEP